MLSITARISSQRSISSSKAAPPGSSASVDDLDRPLEPMCTHGMTCAQFFRDDVKESHQSSPVVGQRYGVVGTWWPSAPM